MRLAKGLVLTLKLGWVVRVMFCLVHWVKPGLKIIQVWPGLDHMQHEIKKCKHNDRCHTQRLFSWATPTFSMIFLAVSARRAICLISCVYVYAKVAIYSSHRATPMNPLLLQDCKSATLAVCQGILFYKARPANHSLYESISNFTNHVPVPASLRVVTATDYVFVIVCMHSLVSVTCRWHNFWTHSMVLPIPVSSCDPVSMLTCVPNKLVFCILCLICMKVSFVHLDHYHASSFLFVMSLVGQIVFGEVPLKIGGCWFHPLAVRCYGRTSKQEWFYMFSWQKNQLRIMWLD